MFCVIRSNNGILIVTMVACLELTNTLQLTLPRSKHPQATSKHL